MVVVDNNILSSLSTGEALHLLPASFDGIVTVPEVVRELRSADLAGFAFVEDVEDVLAFEEASRERWLRVSPATRRRNVERERLVEGEEGVSPADAACLVAAREREEMLLTDDRQLADVARTHGVQAVDLPAFLLSCIRRGIFDDRSDVLSVVRRIEERDYYRFSPGFYQRLDSYWDRS